MRIAILGAGFAGLATSWYLSHHSAGSVTIDLYDPQPIGLGTSGYSSGLLHLYGGKHATKTREGEKKLNCTNQLFSEASRAVGRSFVLSKGILRPAITEDQIEDFKMSAAANDDVKWWEKERCEEKVSGLQIPAHGGGLYIPEGLTIDVGSYLEGLWKACALMGTQFFQKAITNDSQMQQYDRVIFATGAASKNLNLLQSLPLEVLKGQVLTLKWPSHLPPLPFSLNSEGYLIMGKDHKTCIAGSTYEREFKTPQPEMDVAIPLIRKKIAPFFPQINDFEIIDCRAGIRAANQRTHLPMLGRVASRAWFITGLGSKGLLFHAYLGDLLAQAILKDDPSLIPRDLRYGI